MTRILWAAFASLPLLPLPAAALETSEVLTNYANIAAAAYGDSLTTAATLKAAVAALVASPSQANLTAARAAYLAARVPYMQNEAFRFGNPIVDDWAVSYTHRDVYKRQGPDGAAGCGDDHHCRPGASGGL